MQVCGSWASTIRNGPAIVLGKHHTLYDSQQAHLRAQWDFHHFRHALLYTNFLPKHIILRSGREQPNTKIVHMPEVMRFN